MIISFPSFSSLGKSSISISLVKEASLSFFSSSSIDAISCISGSITSSFKLSISETKSLYSAYLFTASSMPPFSLDNFFCLLKSDNTSGFNNSSFISLYLLVNSSNLSIIVILLYIRKKN